MLMLQAWLARRIVDAGRHAAQSARYGCNSSVSTLAAVRLSWQSSASISCVCTAAAGNPSLQRPKPGTVKHYDYHFFIRNPTHVSAKDMDFSRLWPPAIERLPPFVEVFKAIAQAKALDPDVGTVKVTAFDDLSISREAVAHDDGGCVDVMAYPSGARYEQLPRHMLQLMVDAHLGLLQGPEQVQPLQPYMIPTGDIQLFVCCHAARDERCGMQGPALLRRLRQLVAQDDELQDCIEVFPCSHVGGSEHAGNVVAYGLVSPCDGDWFGGVDHRKARRFLEAIAYMQVDQQGGPSHPALRSLWRGRMGMTPEEQLQLFSHPEGESEEDPAVLDDLEEDEALTGQELADAEAELVGQLSQFRQEFEKHVHTARKAERTSGDDKHGSSQG